MEVCDESRDIIVTQVVLFSNGRKTIRPEVKSVTTVTASHVSWLFRHACQSRDFCENWAINAKKLIEIH